MVLKKATASSAHRNGNARLWHLAWRSTDSFLKGNSIVYGVCWNWLRKNSVTKRRCIFLHDFEVGFRQEQPF